MNIDPEVIEKFLHPRRRKPKSPKKDAPKSDTTAAPKKPPATGAKAGKAAAGSFAGPSGANQSAKARLAAEVKLREEWKAKALKAEKLLEATTSKLTACATVISLLKKTVDNHLA
jgi:hypothetical protein